MFNRFVIRTIPVYLTVISCTTWAQDAKSIFQGLQFHGNLTQGLLASSGNNYLTTDSNSTSLQWTEGSLSVSRSITDQLRAGAQVHSYRLGRLGRQRVTLDWAYVDYKPSRYFGIRAGRVKTPNGLYNDVQDIDAVYPWALLPQSMYAVDTRGFTLAHNGAVLYGEVASTRQIGTFEYQVFGGQRTQSRIEGFSELLAVSGISFKECAGPSFGVDLRWRLPVRGLMIGSTYSRSRQTTTDATIQGMPIPVEVTYSTQPQLYAQYENGNLTLSAEWRISSVQTAIGPVPPTYNPARAAYAMGSYRVMPKVSVGTYYGRGLGFFSGNRDRDDPKNYQRDFAINTRFDANRWVYFKLEGHVIHGVNSGFYPQNNPDGMKEKTNLLLAKVGFTF